MIKKIIVSALCAINVCAVMAGCSGQKIETSSSDTVVDITNAVVTEETTVITEPSNDEDIPTTETDVETEEIRTNIIDGISYTIKGQPCSSSVFEGFGPQDYTFDNFSVSIKTDSEAVFDVMDNDALSKYCASWVDDLESNGVSVSEVLFETIEIPSLEIEGVGLTYNTTTEALDCSCKKLLFNGYSGCVTIVEFSSFSENKEAIIETKFNEFVDSLQLT